MGSMVVLGVCIGLAWAGGAQPQNNDPPQWSICAPDHAVPARHRYCEQRTNTALMQALYGPLEGNTAEPEMVEYDLSVRRNDNQEDHAMWNGRIGYVYLKITPTGSGGTGSGGPEQLGQPDHGQHLAYRMSIRTTRSLLSSPGSTLVTQLVEPPETSGNRSIRGRCFLLDQGDVEAHSARCELLDGENQDSEVGLEEGWYVELYTENDSRWKLGARKQIKDLGPDDPARKFLNWARENAKEQGLDPPALPW
ncbi:MAG: hypothetical protein IT436_05890 [Phycisphaerales bacterium]|nr:hypothetical protein [Phycisphaerales bacterium]